MGFDPSEARDENGRWSNAIAGLLLELKSLELNNAGFDALVARLRASDISQADLHKLTTQYIGYDLAKSKSKKELFQKIVDTQALTARQNARMPYQNPYG